MRLPEVERGDALRSRVLIRFISAISGFRLPDAARVAFYHRDFLGRSFGAWTQSAMRGPSEWSVGERELMAAMVAEWNSNRFCRGAHRAVAALGVEPAIVDSCLSDYHAAAIGEQLRATLRFLEVMTRQPDTLDASHVHEAMASGVSREQLADAAAVAAVFNVITRYADALDFIVPSEADLARAAAMLLKRGYG